MKELLVGDGRQDDDISQPLVSEADNSETAAGEVVEVARNGVLSCGGGISDFVSSSS